MNYCISPQEQMTNRLIKTEMYLDHEHHTAVISSKKDVNTSFLSLNISLA